MNTTLWSIINKTERDFRRPLELNLANREHADYIERCFGGKEHFSTRYPDLYDLFQNGTARAADLLSDGTVKKGKEGFHDAAYVVDVLYHQERKCAYAVGDMNLIQSAKRLYLSLDIYKGEERIGHNAEFYNGVNYGRLECYSQQFDIPQGEVQKYKAVITATWQPQDANYLRAMLATEASDIGYGSNVDVVSSMTIKDPVHKVSQQSDPIKVAYARYTPDMDYVYPETRDPATREEEVYLDMSGEVQLKEGHIYDRLVSFNALLQCDGYGTIFYNKEADEKQIKPSEDGKTFRWNLDRDWDSAIPDSVKFGNRLHSFDMQLKFYCSGDEAIHKIVVSSDDYPELKGSNSYQKISKIRLYWGCIAEDTQILMADGSEKRADSIAIGDKILDRDGNTDTISKVIDGTSQTMYCLKLESGKELLATDDHPVYTDQGFMAVIDLNTDSRVLTPGGKGEYEDVIYCYPLEYKGKIYSFELENGNTLCTNGMVTGSYTEQGKIADRLNAVRDRRDEIDAAAAAEVKRLREDDTAGRIFA